jgi:NADH:ubiquinone oxidoreductase subunit 3 (subunit A)
MNEFLLSPPMAFVIFLLLSFVFSKLVAKLAAKGKNSDGKLKAYACGEDIPTHKIQPNYKQFFSFAFFFTIMHIIALLLTTIPRGIPPVAFVYILVAAIAIFILYKR